MIDTFPIFCGPKSGYGSFLGDRYERETGSVGAGATAAARRSLAAPGVKRSRGGARTGRKPQRGKRVGGGVGAPRAQRFAGEAF